MESVPTPQRSGKSKKGGQGRASPVPAARPAAEPGILATPPAPTADVPVVVRIWQRLRREPSMMVTVAYLLVSFLGLWANYWFYRGFGLPILEYMQPGDYLVAGLRDPAYALLLLASLLFSLAITWPETKRRRDPAQVAAWRKRWWGPLVFPESRWFRWKLLGVKPETGVMLGITWAMLWASAAYVNERGALIRQGRTGEHVLVGRADAQGPAREATLLGSSGMFVFVWWADAAVAEAIPIEAVTGLKSAMRKRAAPAQPPVPAVAPSLRP